VLQKQYITLPEIKLVGISTRTNNKNEFDPAQAKIPNIIERYFKDEISEQILHRRNPGITYCCYADYETDMHGDYTYYIGEEVIRFDDQVTKLDKLTITAQSYARFTKGPGKMPDICIEMWQQIWQMSDKDFGGSRNYKTDFELYGERSKDKLNTTLDIYIGINK